MCAEKGEEIERFPPNVETVVSNGKQKLFLIRRFFKLKYVIQRGEPNFPEGIVLSFKNNGGS